MVDVETFLLEYFDTSLKNVWKQWSVYNYKKYNK